MNYCRVCPRDLFNESKLLKCMGKMVLLVLDNKIPGLMINDSECDDGFCIEQNQNDGSIYISNLQFFDEARTEVEFYTPYNSKDNWPLVMRYKGQEYYPINEDGEYQLYERLFLQAMPT